MTSKCLRASCTCPYRGMTHRQSWRLKNICNRCAAMHPGVRAISSLSAASTAWTVSRTYNASSLKRPIWHSDLAMSILAHRLPPPLTRATAWSPPNTIRPEPGHPRMPLASAALIYVFTEWKVRAAISLLDVPYRCGTATARRKISPMTNPGCCVFSTRSVFIRSVKMSC